MSEASSPCYKPNRYFLELIVGAGFTRSKSRKIYDALLKQITNALVAGEAVRVANFGSLRMYQRRARPAPGRPPLPADTPPRNSVRFRPGRALKFLAAQLTNFEPESVAGTSSARLETTHRSEQVTPTPAPRKAARRERRLAQFETHYNIGIAYVEMSLYELAIKELESAASLVEPDDEERRYIHCCNLLGICYSAMGNCPEAEKWLLCGLEVSDRTEEAYKALRYELGLVYEAWGKIEQASEAFFDVYTIDVNFRRVRQKIKALQTRYIENKRGERRPQLIPVTLRGRDSSGKRFQEETLIVNISRRGAGLRISRALEPGSFLELHFASARRMKFGKVVWCAPVNNPEGGFQAGVLLYNEPPK